jgi:hypothetical protein
LDLRATAVIALYFNVFVGVVQAFLKVPALHALAPTQTEPPFKLTQLIRSGAFQFARHSCSNPIPGVAISGRDNRGLTLLYRCRDSTV